MSKCISVVDLTVGKLVEILQALPQESMVIKSLIPNEMTVDIESVRIEDDETVVID